MSSADNPFAPAIHQLDASFQTLRSSWLSEGVVPSKTQALRCFQRHQAVRMMRELSPRQTSFCIPVIAFPHQSLKLTSSTWGQQCCKPTLDSTTNQICREKEQATCFKLGIQYMLYS
uniref:Uncharacterized protein n=1 Tax=Arundo donax TaxID=35708 RepID=A0A0A9DTW5_ARUDO